MTPGSPDEALHFRGKTLTPESPRPVHIAEPANIPVLQHQMDPIFNDTSTYETRELVPQGVQQVKHDTPNDPRAVPRSQAQQQQQNGGTAVEQQYTAAAGPDSAGVRGNAGRMQELGHHHHQQQYQQQESLSSSHPGSYHVGSFSGNGLMSMNKTDFSATAFPANLSAPSTDTSSIPSTPIATEARNEAARNSSLTAPPSDPASSLTHQAIPNRLPPPSSSPSHAPQGFPAANEVDHPMTDWNAQSTAPEDRLNARDPSHDDNAPSSGEGGVDFQNLLDNLPSSSSTIPSTPAVSEAAPSSMPNYASAIPQATVTGEGASDEAHQNPMGLPPRPPPQEEPTTHTSYPTDDIRTYHQLPSQSSNPPTTYSSQQQQSNDNYQSNLGAPALVAAGAPGTSSGASSLPPPPGLALQKTESSNAELKEPPVLKNGRTEKPPMRTPKNNDEDVPWGPEVQRKYDDFLHNERIYVTEGLWDRFPPGSRLFVGQSRFFFFFFRKQQMSYCRCLTCVSSLYRQSSN